MIAAGEEVSVKVLSSRRDMEGRQWTIPGPDEFF
jgi:hypothetical protein